MIKLLFFTSYKFDYPPLRSQLNTSKKNGNFDFYRCLTARFPETTGLISFKKVSIEISSNAKKQPIGKSLISSMQRNLANPKTEYSDQF